MFDHQSEPRGFSPPLFLVQLFAAPLGSLICGGLATEVLDEMLGTKNGNLLGYLCYAAFGFVLGYKMQVSFPRSVESGGRWIWLAPALFGGLLAFPRQRRFPPVNAA